MTHEGPPIEWAAVREAGREGRLMELLPTLPRARWTERDEYGRILLHYAVWGANEAALVTLIQSGLGVNVCDRWQAAPVHYAAARTQLRALEVLCAARGVDLRERNINGDSPLDFVLKEAAILANDACVRVLVANGVRLRTASKHHRHEITRALVEFERGVLHRRAAVAAMLRVKRAGGQLLVRWDKFLLKQIALELWATRCDEE